MSSIIQTKKHQIEVFINESVKQLEWVMLVVIMDQSQSILFRGKWCSIAVVILSITSGGDGDICYMEPLPILYIDPMHLEESPSFQKPNLERALLLNCNEIIEDMGKMQLGNGQMVTAVYGHMHAIQFSAGNFYGTVVSDVYLNVGQLHAFAKQLRKQLVELSEIYNNLISSKQPQQQQQQQQQQSPPEVEVTR
ncbi:hypothetical protein EV182_001094 [Spiromyces aspiralis]|uniref:Uncharacterized protein n=1 Tax=Spiromyces aspiralis TaxID=68401 RepID=A0ACC1HTM3_9FUNG|nr:hypothetical protein EV182_001094 [Spiromyces aspiralis]